MRVPAGNPITPDTRSPLVAPAHPRFQRFATSLSRAGSPSFPCEAGGRILFFLPENAPWRSSPPESWSSSPAALRYKVFASGTLGWHSRRVAVTLLRPRLPASASLPQSLAAPLWSAKRAFSRVPSLEVVVRMCPQFLFVDTNSAHKDHHPQSLTSSTHGHKQTLTTHVNRPLFLLSVEHPATVYGRKLSLCNSPEFPANKHATGTAASRASVLGEPMCCPQCSAIRESRRSCSRSTATQGPRYGPTQ